MWEEKVKLIHAQTEGTATQLATLKFLRDNLVEKVWYMVTTWVFLILMILETVPQLGGRKAQELIKPISVVDKVTDSAVYAPVLKCITSAYFFSRICLTWYAAPVDPNLGYSRWKYAVRGRTLMRLAAFVACIVDAVTPDLGEYQRTECVLNLLQLAFILNIDDIHDIVPDIAMVWMRLRDNVIEVFFITVTFWMWGACLWYLAENNKMEGSFHESQEEIFSSLPAVLYYNVFFMVCGEWTCVDFTEYGAMCAILYCFLFNLGVGTLPVGL